MLIKCICSNCAGHLSFDDSDAGASIDCPHCGFKTILELPDAKKADPEMTSLIQKLVFRRRLFVGMAALLVLAAVGFALYHWGVPWIMDRVLEIESRVTAMVILVLLCLALPFLVFWLVFPALLWFQLRKISQILNRIADQSPTEEVANPPAEEEQTQKSHAQGEADPVPDPNQLTH